MTTARLERTVGAVAAVALVAGIVALSQVPWGGGSDRTGLLRLAWRARAVRVEECRRLTPEEVARLPAHMRREQVCEGRVVPYVLALVVDGDTVLSDTVRAAGARGDRPLYVNVAWPLEPGTYPIEVRFTRPVLADPVVEARAASPPRLGWRGVVTLAAGEVVLVTMEPEASRLVARGAGTIMRDSSSAALDSLNRRR